jgi:hypothetical protein
MHDNALPPLGEHADRDRFRHAVGALPPGPLRDVLTAVAYARDAAARTGTGAAPHDRWQAVVAVAERAVHTEPAPRPARRGPRRTPHGVDVRSGGTAAASTTGGGTARRRRAT